MLSEETAEGPVPIGIGLEQRVLGMQQRLREQGAFESTEKAVDWTTSEGRNVLDWRMRLAGVPEEYRQADLQRCRLRSEVTVFNTDIRNNVDQGRGVLVFGPVGSGKSSTAALVVAEAVKQKIPTKWSYVPDLCDLLMDHKMRREVMAQQTERDLLVWDDFAVRPLSAWEIGLLDQIVERRYRSRRSMVVTTNQTVEVFRRSDELRRMRDRWRQRNQGWVIGGESMRKPEL